MPSISPADGRLAVLAEAELLWDAFSRNDVSVVFPKVETPLVSVVIVSYGAPRLLLWTLAKLAVQDRFERLPFEVVIVDNASNAETRDLLARVDGAEIVLSDTNLGFGGGCNRGADQARGELLLFLNPDVALMPGAITALAETCLANDEIGIVGGRLVYPGGEVQEAGCFLREDDQLTHPYGRGWDDALRPELSFERDVTFVSGAMLLVRASVFRELGGFDLAYGQAYFEDADLCVRCWKAGLRVVYQPAASAIHSENATSPDPKAVADHFARNRPLFLARHADWVARCPAGTPDLDGRHEDRGRPNILVVAETGPATEAMQDWARAIELVGSLSQSGYLVTLHPMAEAIETGPASRQGIPPRVEVMRPGSREGLQRHLADRQGHYDVVWALSPPGIAEIGRPHGHQSRPLLVVEFATSQTLARFTEASLGGHYFDSVAFQAGLRAEADALSFADVIVCRTVGLARMLEQTPLAHTTQVMADTAEGAVAMLRAICEPRRLA